MLHRERVELPHYVYPKDEWRMVEKKFHPRFLAEAETIFSVGNGYLGMRGNFEEGAPIFESGTFVNGFYESWPIIYGEEACGFPKTGQTIVNVPDTRIIKLYVDDEPFYLPTATLLNFERVLDMQAGTLAREVLWETPSGKHVSIKSSRIVSLQHRHIAAISYEVKVLNAKAPISISSEVVPSRSNNTNKDDPRKSPAFDSRSLVPLAKSGGNYRMIFGHMTESSRMALACGIDHSIATECRYSSTIKQTEDSGKVVFSVEARPGIPVHIKKYITYHSSRNAQALELCERAERTLDRALGHGFGELLLGQRQALDDFWKRSDVQVVADPSRGESTTEEAQQAIRFNLFQILQASGRAEGAGIPAKGLTGQAYEGHYFWDTEIYVLPFLTYTAPRIAGNLLKFRHSMLEQARKRATEVNQKGALFPWRTINGQEASAYYAAGTAQYHINADIMYALKRYVTITGDEDFLQESGAEMLVETARLWVDLGFYSERRGGKFCIHGVTGPDEYNTVVDNNTYTNLMARRNLWYAAETITWLRNRKQERFASLVDKTGLDIAEVKEWKRAADSMYIPFDEETGIRPQDDSFLDKEIWDFDKTPEDKYPLLLHYHPLVIYRHQVIKQVDVVLAMFLLSCEFSAEEKRLNFEYYDARTTGDSSLSVGIQSIIAAEIGYMKKAAEYCRYAVLMDLGNVSGNVRDGCHIASMGATWMVFVCGFGGLRDDDGHVSFDPRLPSELERLQFPLTVRGCLIHVDIGRESVKYSLQEGEGVTVRHRDEEIHLSPEAPVCIRSHVPPQEHERGVEDK
jgi:alpha,alpha-trehalose phosphorylase